MESVKVDIRSPFPWFGGKSAASELIWKRFGDVKNYVEPFAGSLAVLLTRPHWPFESTRTETVNDADCYLANFWRALQADPEAVAEFADWPVNEADLHARHLWLVNVAKETVAKLRTDPEFYDAKIAGWWVWGICQWIGSGWCSGNGPWIVQDGEMIDSRQLPHLGNNGQGANRPQLREPGVAIENDDGREFHPMTMPELRRWFLFLSARLRHVRILNGDWRRAVTTGAAFTLPVRQGGVCGVFVDPPYADSAGRTMDLYTEDCGNVAHEAREWALEAGTDKRWRIVFKGFDGEHGTAFADAGWREVEWFKAGWFKGGMAQQGDEGHQQARERLWLSPHCLAPALVAPPAQLDMFGNPPAPVVSAQLGLGIGR